MASDRQRGLKTGRAEGASASDDGAVASVDSPITMRNEAVVTRIGLTTSPVSAGLGNAAI